MGQQVNVYESLNLYDSIGGVSKTITSPTQWFTEESVAKQYKIGTRLQVDDMVFHYGHCAEYAESGNYKGRGMMILGKQTAGTHLLPGYRRAGTVAAFTTASTTLTLTMDSEYAPTANEFEDGHITVRSYESAYAGMCRARIRTNDAESGDTTVFYLKEAMNGSGGGASSSPDAKVHWNQYAHVGQPAVDKGNRTCCVGCANVTITKDYYAWLQTWGPYVAQASDSVQGPGLGTYNSAVYFDAYGGFINPVMGSIYGEQTGSAQLAGFVMANRYSGAGIDKDWSPLVMLQITPL